MCTIDASEAVKALGIKRPVHFVIKHDSDPVELVLETVVTGGLRTAGVAPEDGDHHVTVRPDAVAFTEDNIQRVVAHELFHVAQQESFGTVDGAVEAYRVAGLDPNGNHFELEADHEARNYASLIKVSGCESHIDTISELLPGYHAVHDTHE